jgi:hypothetical protein
MGPKSSYSYLRNKFPKDINFSKMNIYDIRACKFVKNVNINGVEVLVTDDKEKFNFYSETKTCIIDVWSSPLAHLYTKVNLPSSSNMSEKHPDYKLLQRGLKFVEENWNELSKEFEGKWFNFWFERIRGEECSRIHLGSPSIPYYNVNSFGVIGQRHVWVYSKFEPDEPKMNYQPDEPMMNDIIPNPFEFVCI